MANGNSLRDEIKEENKKMKDMSIWGKIGHIWEYYRWRILAVIASIVAVVAVVMMVVNNQFERSMYCAVIDGDMRGFSDHSDYLTTNFTKYLGIDGKSQRVIFDSNYTFSSNEFDIGPYYDVENIMVRAASKTLDCYISEIEYAKSFAGDDAEFYEDLRNILTEEEINKLSDYLIYFTNKSGKEIPISIDLKDSKLLTDAGMIMKHPCFCVTSTSEHKENCAQFIRFIFGL